MSGHGKGCRLGTPIERIHGVRHDRRRLASRAGLRPLARPGVLSADDGQRDTRCPPERSQVGGQPGAGLIELALDTLLGLQQASGWRSLPFTRCGCQLVERQLRSAEEHLARSSNLRPARQLCRHAHRVTPEAEPAVTVARGLRTTIPTAVEHR